MSELFGAPSGYIAFNQDQNTQASTQERYAQIQHLGALTDQSRMQTQLEAANLAKQQRMLQLLAQGPQTVGVDSQGNPMTPADKMTDLGSRLLDGGFITEGSNLLNRASEIGNREAVQKVAAQRAKIALVGQQMKQYDSLNNMLASSTDPQSFEAAKMVWLNENPGETIPPQMQTYDPGTIAMLQRSTKAGQAALRLEQQQLVESDRDAYRDASLDERARTNDIREAREAALSKYRDRRLQLQEKNAGPKAPVIGSAKNADVLAASTMIKRDFPDMPDDMPIGTSGAKASAAAYDLAQEAKAKMATNRGMSMPEAMTQVYADMKTAGVFTQTPKAPTMVDKVLGKDPGQTTTYKPKDVTPPVPYNPGTTTPVENTRYTVKDGSVWRFKGGKFIREQ